MEKMIRFFLLFPKAYTSGGDRGCAVDRQGSVSAGAYGVHAGRCVRDRL